MTGPSLTVAREVLSIPWQQTTSVHNGKVRVAYRASSCATLFSTTGSGSTGTGKYTLTVEVAVTFDHSQCRTTTDTTDIRLFPSFPAPPDAPAVPAHLTLAHGPTGPVSVLEAGRIAGGLSGSDAHASSVTS